MDGGRWPRHSAGIHLDSASRVEVKLLVTTLDNVEVRPARKRDPWPQPQRLLLDRVYDSDPLWRRLAGRGIEMIGPHRKNRVKPKTQDGRKRRRYKAALEGGGHVRLAGELPPPGRAVRTGAQDVPGVLPRRLPLDHTPPVMKALLGNPTARSLPH